MAVSEEIFPALEYNRPRCKLLAFRFIVLNSSCIVSLLPLKFGSILLSGLPGRRKICMNHTKHEETRER